MQIVGALAVLVAVGWAINHWFRSPCLNCGHLPYYCLECAQQADRRMRGIE